MLKYLIRRTDISLFVNNVRLALATGRIHCIVRDSIEYLFDYSLGLVECIWDIENLTPDSIRILQWLILTYGGIRTWDMFARIVRRDIRVAMRVIENSQLEPPRPSDLVRMINYLQVYSSMLQRIIEYDCRGGPPSHDDQDEARGTRELLDSNIPTINQERLAFRLELTLRELRWMKDIIVVINFSTLVEGPEREHQSQPQAKMEGQSHTSAADPSRSIIYQNNAGPSTIHYGSGINNTILTQQSINPVIRP